MAEQIVVTGKMNLMIGFPQDDYATMHKLGEQLDDTRITFEHVTYDVPGDSQGGPQGDPIEKQLLAYRVFFGLNLSKWSPRIFQQLQKHNVLNRQGSFADHEIGCLMLRDRSFRICLCPASANPIPAQDEIPFLNPAYDATTNPTPASEFAAQDFNLYNFPCCLVSSPKELGAGTKFSALAMQVQAFRVPEGHPLAPTDPREGLIWNKDTNGIDAKYLPVEKAA